MNQSRKFFVLFLIFCLSVSIYFCNLSLINELKSRIVRRNSATTTINRLNAVDSAACTLETCFDMTRCAGHDSRSRPPGLKIYIYPQPKQIVTKIYTQIIDYLNSSTYVTSDPNEACLFVAALDTLDRDKLSGNFIRHLDKSIGQLTYWNGGQNHLIFNLYSGSWPDYVETALEMNVSKAILVKASFSAMAYRPGFDLSFPLFHPDVPYNTSTNTTRSIPVFFKKYFLTFKVNHKVFN